MQESARPIKGQKSSKQYSMKMEFQSNAYLLSESEHIHWILDLEGGVHLRWVL